MSLGKNIQYLRKQKKVTQEEFAERMLVSRQTVSKWELDDVIPEMNKLVDMCNYFSCTLDGLVREDLSATARIYSEVTIQKVPPFKMARYVMISPNPEDDVNDFMNRWAEQSGLLSFDANAKRIGWDFPYVTAEQQNRFGLRGYASAYILPEGFEPKLEGVEIAEQKEAMYAVITIQEPFMAPFERIPNAYKIIMEYLQANGFVHKMDDNIIPCYEYEYVKDGVTYMDVYVHTDAVTKANVWSSFS